MKKPNMVLLLAVSGFLAGSGFMILGYCAAENPDWIRPAQWFLNPLFWLFVAGSLCYIVAAIGLWEENRG